MEQQMEHSGTELLLFDICVQAEIIVIDDLEAPATPSSSQLHCGR